MCEFAGDPVLSIAGLFTHVPFLLLGVWKDCTSLLPLHLDVAQG